MTSAVADDELQEAPEAAPRRRLGPLVLLVALLVALAVTAGLVLGLRWGAGAGVPVEGSADAGFARDMQAHHRQAVQMSALVLESSEDPLVRSLALDIELTQQQQAGQMYGWLEQWGLPQSGPQPVMEWMQGTGLHSQHVAAGEAGSRAVSSMPGMATGEQLQQLSAADGAAADRLYLQLMIPHHEAGVEMATAGLELAEDDAVRTLARSIENSQEAELTVLRDMLDERGGALPTT